MKKINEWKVVKNWKFLLVALGVFILNVMAQLAVFRLPNFDGGNLYIGASVLVIATLVGLWITTKLDLWKSDKKWRWFEAFGFISISFIVLHGVKMIGSQLIMLEEGFGKTSVNQAAIQNSGMPALILFLFTVLFAPVLEELVFRGLLMGKIFGKDSIVGLLLSSFLFGLIHTPTNIGSWVVYGGMGLVLGLLYRLSGKYSYSLILHLVNNLLGVTLLLLMQSLGLV